MSFARGVFKWVLNSTEMRSIALPIAPTLSLSLALRATRFVVPSSFSFARFVPGRWHNIKLSMVLNDPGKTNGYVELRVDGRLVTSFDNMVWRQNRKVNIEAIDVASWFGGSDATWAPSRDTYSLIKNMRAYRTGSPTYSKLSGGRVAPLSEEDVTSETVTEYEDIYADITEEAYDDDF